VQHQIDTIIRSSDIVEDMIQAKRIAIIGAIYDIATGKVKFLEDTYVH
jgi:carbonic anhydrase